MNTPASTIRFHVTYLDRHGNTQVEYVEVFDNPAARPDKLRRRAMKQVSWRQNVPMRNIKSAVSARRPTT